MHHIVLDGWSLPVLFHELSQAYAAGGDPSGLPPVASYRDYLAWLNRQDQDAARAAWAEALAGITEPTLLVPAGQDTPAPVLPHHLSTRTGQALAGRLRDTARTLGLTLNTVVQGAWAQLLGTLTGRTDVVFGATVAGRPAELPGVERMLGLFINTLPVRVNTGPRAPADRHPRRGAVPAVRTPRPPAPRPGGGPARRRTGRHLRHADRLRELPRRPCRRNTSPAA
ncbi:hypothetical protein SFUMM280S_02779 [Streptomyces fumanus]